MTDASSRPIRTATLLLPLAIAIAFSAVLSLLNLIDFPPRHQPLSYLMLNAARFVIWGLLATAIMWGALHFPVQRRRWALPVAALLGLCFGVSFASELLFHALVGQFPSTMFPDAYTDPSSSLWQRATDDGLTINFLLSLGIVLGVHTRRFYTGYRQGELRRARLQTELTRTRLEILRRQLDPHFLFNTLNSVAELAQKDPAASQRTIRQLAHLLRDSIQSMREQEVELGRELEFVRNYLAIQQTRFADRLTVDYSVDPEILACRIPSLVLQPLVENSIRHGIYSSRQALRIGITARKSEERIELEVGDNGRGGEAAEVREGLGISNLRKRLGELYGDRYRLELRGGRGGGFAVKLALPLA